MTYSGASDAGSGLNVVRLYYRHELSAGWSYSGHFSSAASGTFYFNSGNWTGALPHEGKFFFGLRAQDNAGTWSTVPVGTGDTSTIYDIDTPETGGLTVPALDTSGGIDIPYGATADRRIDHVNYTTLTTLSGIKSIQLWYAYNTTATWFNSGLAPTATTGTFAFNPPAGANGWYFFGLKVFDRAGNSTSTVTGSGEGRTLYDTQAPLPGTAVSPAFGSGTSITVTYTGASDNIPGGLVETRLWYKFGAGGVWTSTSLTSTLSNGTFYFVPPAQGIYYFDLVATDKAGNQSAAAGGTGDTMTVYDSLDPTPATASSPAYDTVGAIPVNYAGAADGESGLKEVQLWYTYNTTLTVWLNSGQKQTGVSGSFNFNPPSGDGTYYFGLKTVDNADNTTSTASGSGDDSTIFDDAAPNPGVVDSPAFDGGGAIPVSYTGASDAVSGLKEVQLWYAYLTTATWYNTSLILTAGSGTFNFVPTDGDGRYIFDTVATDNAGNSSIVPTSGSPGDDSTIYDTGPPTLGTLSGLAYSNERYTTITFANVSDDGTGVASVNLWRKNWLFTTWAQNQTVAPDDVGGGYFTYDSLTLEGTHFFGMVATDNAGHSRSTSRGTPSPSPPTTRSTAPTTSTAR